MVNEKFEALCACVDDKTFWKSFSDCSISRGNLKYYLNKFCKRVQFLIKDKKISQCNVDGFITTMAIRKFKISCELLYSVENYNEVDKKNNGKHLSDISDCYEWIARELGVPQEKLNNIRLSASVRCSNKLFEGG